MSSAPQVCLLSAFVVTSHGTLLTPARLSQRRMKVSDEVQARSIRIQRHATPEEWDWLLQ